MHTYWNGQRNGCVAGQTLPAGGCRATTSTCGLVQRAPLLRAGAGATTSLAETVLAL